MATSWVKSLQCKSRAYEDVYTSTSCRNSYQNLKDVVNVEHSKPKPKDKPDVLIHDPFNCKARRSHTIKPKTRSKTVEKPSTMPGNRVRRTMSAPITKGLDLSRVGFGPFFPSVTELQTGHPSRNVVEIIFGTRWGPDGFSGRVEMVFKVHSPARVTAQFEEYRDTVKLRAGLGSGARCVADGNEKMRFHCLGPNDVLGRAGLGKPAVCTYSGSGAAHASGGGGKGRRAMVVCRVIAGRVLKRAGLKDPMINKLGEMGEFDSISGENGELVVFDSNAMLPCFLVIYKL